MDKKKTNVLMFGPGLQATSGISNVVNNWIRAGIDQTVNLDYVSTLDDYVSGQYLIKSSNAARSYIDLIKRYPKSVDLVHIHLSSGMSFYRKLVIFIFAKMRGLKVAIHLHGSTFEKFYQQGNAVQKKLIESVFNRADGILVLSKKWKSFVQGISVNPHIYVIYNGAPLDVFSASACSQKADRDENNPELKIVFMGRLGKRKGTYDLLEAFVRLNAEIPATRLILGGDGEVEEVQSLVREKGLASKVDVLGWVSGDAKYEVFKQADIYTLPSYNEGLPGSVLEAMAASKPIVSTPVGGIPEAVLEGQNGYLVEPGDVDGLYQRLKALCEDEKLRVSMGEMSGKIIRQKFNLEKILIDLQRAYDDMLSAA